MIQSTTISRRGRRALAHNSLKLALIEFYTKRRIVCFFLDFFSTPNIKKIKKIEKLNETEYKMMRSPH